MLNTNEDLAPFPPSNNVQSFFDAVDADELERAEYDNDFYYSYEDIYDEVTEVSKRDNSKSSVSSLRAATPRFVKKNKIDVKASPP